MYTQQAKSHHIITMPMDDARHRENDWNAPVTQLPLCGIRRSVFQRGTGATDQCPAPIRKGHTEGVADPLEDGVPGKTRTGTHSGNVGAALRRRGAWTRNGGAQPTGGPAEGGTLAAKTETLETQQSGDGHGSGQSPGREAASRGMEGTEGSRSTQEGAGRWSEAS